MQFASIRTEMTTRDMFRKPRVQFESMKTEVRTQDKYRDLDEPKTVSKIYFNKN